MGKLYAGDLDVSGRLTVAGSEVTSGGSAAQSTMGLTNPLTEQLKIDLSEKKATETDGGTARDAISISLGKESTGSSEKTAAILISSTDSNSNSNPLGLKIWDVDQKKMGVLHTGIRIAKSKDYRDKRGSESMTARCELDEIAIGGGCNFGDDGSIAVNKPVCVRDSTINCDKNDVPVAWYCKGDVGSAGVYSQIGNAFVICAQGLAN